MTGAQYVILAYALAGGLFIAFGASLWLKARRLPPRSGAPQPGADSLQHAQGGSP